MRFELGPTYLIRFEFRVDGNTPRLKDGIPGWMRYGTHEAIRAVDHEGRVMGFEEQVAEVSAPGVYEISFEGIGADRFQPILPQRVDVQAGETAEVIVELRRK